MPVTEITHDFHEAHELMAGPAYMFKWVGATWGEAARNHLVQMLAFYLVLVAGFISLYMIMANTQKINEMRSNVASVMAYQRNQHFDEDEYMRRPTGLGYL